MFELMLSDEQVDSMDDTETKGEVSMTAPRGYMKRLEGLCSGMVSAQATEQQNKENKENKENNCKFAITLKEQLVVAASHSGCGRRDAGGVFLEYMGTNPR